jgi:superfamily II DNA helicase RecQ
MRLPSHIALLNQIARIPRLSLTSLSSIINSTRNLEYIPLQEDLVQACLRQILAYKNTKQPEPRLAQVRTLRRLIFSKNNILLIARTRFSKSLIFHAFSIITRKITLQLIPLTKLGNEQLSDIRRFPSASPCLLNAKTKADKKELLKKISASIYTHVLLGLEQASTRAFRNLLKSPELQSQIGLVTINEYHLIAD